MPPAPGSGDPFVSGYVRGLLPVLFALLVPVAVAAVLLGAFALFVRLAPVH
jgi:hypothetical protein